MSNVPNLLFIQSPDGTLISADEAKDGFEVRTTITAGGTPRIRSLDDIDQSKLLTLSPVAHDLDQPLTRPVPSVERVVLVGSAVAQFLAWAKLDGWRKVFEADLQSVAQDVDGFPLLTTWLPLVTFREQFCAGGRFMQDEVTRNLMEMLRANTRHWRDAGVDVVDVSGYIAADA